MPENSFSLKETIHQDKCGFSLKSLGDRLLSRTATLSLIVVILAAMLTATAVPQGFLTPGAQVDAWREAHGHILPLVDVLDLHHVFTTPWFAGLILLASLSLLLSTCRQIKTAWHRTFGLSTYEDRRCLHVSAPLAPLLRALKARGYLRMAHDGRLRYVKHPWGYWGNVLLHVGMVVTIATSLYIALTQQRGMLFLTEGETFFPGAPWQSEAHGMLAGPLDLPEGVRLDRLAPQFNADTTVGAVTSEVTFLSGSGVATKRRVAINSILHHRGLRVYQNSLYGDVFAVDLTDAAGHMHRENLRMPHPQSIDRAGYNDFQLSWSPVGLSAKYFADADRKSMDSPNRQLVLRLTDRGREIARLSLLPGESGNLGDLRVSLAGTKKWSSLIFVNVAGMPAIFFGFFIMVLGGLIHYCAPPREFLIDRTGSGYDISWKAARFGEFYQDEYRSIVATINAGSA